MTTTTPTRVVRNCGPLELPHALHQWVDPVFGLTLCVGDARPATPDDLADVRELLARYDTFDVDARTGPLGQGLLQEVQARALTSIAQALQGLGVMR